MPAWQVATHVTRTQKFPAGKTITVEHSYKPVAGGSVGGMLDRDYRNRIDSGYSTEYAANYCIDKAFAQGFRQKRYQAKGKKGQEGGHDYGRFYVEHWLAYVLKSGANWRVRSRISVWSIDKGNPDNLLSLCMDGVKKIRPDPV